MPRISCQNLCATFPCTQHDHDVFVECTGGAHGTGDCEFEKLVSGKKRLTSELSGAVHLVSLQLVIWCSTEQKL